MGAVNRRSAQAYHWDHTASRVRQEYLDALAARSNGALAHASLCRGIHDLAQEFSDAIVVLPVHLNPNVQSVIRQHLGGIANVLLVPPLPYLRFLTLLLGAKLVIADSGGVQEEAAALGVRFLITRWTTERPEGVVSGVGQIVGPDPRRLLDAARSLLTDEAEYRRRAVPTRAFGDGSVARQIAQAVIAEL